MTKRRRPGFVMRFRAIVCALWYGVLPWWLYERECHYSDMGYCAHLRLNLDYALKWMQGKQTYSDVRFERTVNRRGNNAGISNAIREMMGMADRIAESLSRQRDRKDHASRVRETLNRFLTPPA